MGIDTTVIPLNASAVKADILATVGSDINLLGEVRQFALSISGALSKSQLQAKGWAICDGTTPASQGISSPTITTTPDLREKFLRHSANETTGGTGGSETHLHQWYRKLTGTSTEYRISLGSVSGLSPVKTFNSSGNEISIDSLKASGSSILEGSAYTTSVDTKPPYYDICYFIKVKV